MRQHKDNERKTERERKKEGNNGKDQTIHRLGAKPEGMQPRKNPTSGGGCEVDSAQGSEREAEGRWRRAWVMEAKRGVRNKTHTLVAHHQVRKTLREDKSTVSTENGIMGRFFCHIDTWASPVRRMPAVHGGERGGVKR